jgi:tight adherence protein C
MNTMPSHLVLLTLVSSLAMAVGLWAVFAGLGETRAHSGQGVIRRVAHGLRDVSAEARATLQPLHSDPVSIAGVVLGPSWHRVAASFHQLLGGGSEGFHQAGVAYSADEYRLRRFIAAVIGALVGGGLGLGIWVVRPGTTPLIAVVTVLIGAVAGVGIFDRRVRREAKERRERLVEEFPTVLELLSLALAAGDSLPGALARIARRGSGELAMEWARVLRVVETGQPLSATLLSSANQMGVAEIEALAQHLSAALERGAPLAEVVRAHSSDSRLQQLRAVVERAGKAEVWMLIPLVLLILPITVIFAVWPSLQALQFSF